MRPARPTSPTSPEGGMNDIGGAAAASCGRRPTACHESQQLPSPGPPCGGSSSRLAYSSSFITTAASDNSNSYNSNILIGTLCSPTTPPAGPPAPPAVQQLAPLSPVAALKASPRTAVPAARTASRLSSLWSPGGGHQQQQYQQHPDPPAAALQSSTSTPQMQLHPPHVLPDAEAAPAFVVEAWPALSLSCSACPTVNLSPPSPASPFAASAADGGGLLAAPAAAAASTAPAALAAPSRARRLLAPAPAEDAAAAAAAAAVTATARSAAVQELYGSSSSSRSAPACHQAAVGDGVPGPQPPAAVHVPVVAAAAAGAVDAAAVIINRRGSISLMPQQQRPSTATLQQQQQQQGGRGASQTLAAPRLTYEVVTADVEYSAAPATAAATAAGAGSPFSPPSPADMWGAAAAAASGGPQQGLLQPCLPPQAAVATAASPPAGMIIGSSANNSSSGDVPVAAAPGADAAAAALPHSAAATAAAAAAADDAADAAGGGGGRAGRVRRPANAVYDELMPQRPLPPRSVLHLSMSAPAAMLHGVVSSQNAWGLSNFKVVRDIYQGYASTVHKAECLHSGEPVALKVYRLKGQSDFLRYQMMRELHIHARLAHDSMVHLIGAFQDGNKLVMVQEYMRGGTLARVREELGGRLSEFQAMHLVLVPLLRALAHLHARGIVHRDIKPANLLFTPNWRIKLCDFGVSICLSEERAVTRTGSKDYIHGAGGDGVPAQEPGRGQQGERRARLHARRGRAGRAAAYGPRASSSARREPADELCFPSSVGEPARAFIRACLQLNPADRPTVRELRQHEWVIKSLEAPIKSP
ncbi:hypothetical protein CHLRE_13g576100v5 [Chlamydomonas reinhardtii]|uniref:Protein kinase domain-containing protein n=1 Tax=Chlamydomonas reinhardtii TaxID=3055 RepID=A0A2K3D006_CHLRE|nr:uncharacterized protein CHLRE_13g576100v5 [Chlamydomonas reinhardtii]PNW73868.1 hypothetical protein CHLRE_13g576100v5 [Chlamydomonas reinhardtii]